MDTRIAGSIAGAVATIPMTAMMNAFERWEDLPPQRITENAAEGVLNEEQAEALSITAHFSLGAAAGAGYSGIAGETGLPPVAEGAVYGLAVWGGAYLGVLPHSGLYPSPEHDKKSRTLLMIGAHVVWGAALGLVWHMLAGRERS